MLDEKTKQLVTCMAAICGPIFSTNPVAWYELEKAGITRESMKEQVDRGEWRGPAPVFENAPDRDSDIWKYMVDNA